MKRIALSGFVLCLALFLMSPFDVYGQESPNYVAVKGGIYTPTDDLEDLDTGFSGEVVFGHYFSPNFALEGGIGYFETDGTETDFEPGIGTITIKTDVSVIPIFLIAKGFLPIQIGELYIGGGIGIGFADIDIDVNSPLGPASVSDSDTVFGLELLAGANFNITDNWFFGVEGKYIITSDASISGTLFGFDFDDEGNANGYIITGVVGFRF